MNRFIVAGLGPSVVNWLPPRGYTTIGVNDISQHFVPHHLMVFDPRRKFHYERLFIIENTEPYEKIWIRGRELESWKRFQDHPKVETFTVGKYVTVEALIEVLKEDYMILPKDITSVYSATCLAYRLGAQWIGLIGVDLAGHRALEPRAKRINESFRKLRFALGHLGTELVNLSKDSMLLSIPYYEMEARIP